MVVVFVSWKQGRTSFLSERAIQCIGLSNKPGIYVHSCHRWWDSRTWLIELRFLRAYPEGANDLFLCWWPISAYLLTKLNFKAAGINTRSIVLWGQQPTEEQKVRLFAAVSGVETDDSDGGEESLKGYVSLFAWRCSVYQSSIKIGVWSDWRLCTSLSWMPR